MRFTKLNLFKITIGLSFCYMIINNINIKDMPWWG